MMHRQIVSIRWDFVIDACACMSECENVSMVLDL
jgi:hypothetical protein